MTGCSIAAKRMGNDLVTGKKKIADISSEMKSATASTEALGVAMNIFANVGFMLAITAITKVVSELAQAQSNAVQAAQEATEAYNDELSSIEDYKTRLSELHEELNSGNLSYEETKTKRTELMSIQDELIEKFGTEKGAIESVTEAVKGQVDALDDLNEKSYRDWVAKADKETIWNKLLPWGKSGLDQAVDYMETSQTVSFNDMQNANLSEELQAIQKEIDETIRKKYNLDKSLATFNVTGTPDEIKSQLENIRQDYLDLSKNAFLENGISSEVWEEYRKEAIESINEVINKFDEGLEKHQETYQTYIEGMIKYDSEYSDEYATILQKRAALESAENSGNADNIQKARQEFMDAINNGIQASGSNENIKKYFESLYPELQAEFDSWNFEVAINANTDGLADKAKEIGEKYSATDLLNMVNTDGVQEGEESFNELIDKAIEYGVCTDNSAEEVQKLIDLLVELGIVQDNVQGSTSNNETDILSFSDAWEQLKNSTEDATKGLADELTKLAEAGQLTADALSKADTSEFFKKAGITAEEATNQINALISASTQLQSMSAQISKMSDMLADKKNGNAASASDLAGFDATVKGLESWEEFERVMGSSKSSMEECQAAANALATEWVNNGNYLANLTEENKDYYITQLDNMGIENAEAIVKDTLVRITQTQAMEEEFLAQKKAETSDATYSLINATADEITKFAEEKEYADNVTNALIELALKKQLVNGTTLDFSGDLVNISNYVKALGGTADAIGLLNRIKKGEVYMPGDAMASVIASAQAEIDSALVSGTKTNVQVTPTGSSTYKGGKTKDTKDTKDSKQPIDWIDRKLSVLRSNIDTTKTKFENLFNINSPKNLSKKIKSVTKELKDARKETSNWKSKLDKINISDSLKKQIQSGKKINLSKYSKSEQKAIKSYQTNWSGYKSSLSNENKLTSQLESLNSQRGKKQNLDTQIKQMRELQKADAKAINAYQKKANSVKLSKALKDKVKSGDYKIENYSSDTQALIQEYQGYIDKIRELETEKETLKGDIKDAKIEQYQLYVDNAEAKIAKSQAYAELDSGNYKEQNKHLEAQKKYIKEQYKALIQIAKLKGDTLEVDRLRAEKQKELNDLAKQEFDNIVNTYDNKIGLLNAKAESINNQIGIIETKGYVVSEDYYNSLVTNTKKNLSELSGELIALRQKRDEMLKDGTLEKGSDDWYEIQNAIWSVKNAQDDATKSIIEYQKQIRQLKWDTFDRQEDFISRIQDEGNFLIDLMSNEKLFADDGNWTEYANAIAGLRAMNYNAYMAQVDDYEKEIQVIQQEINNDPYNIDLIQRKQELISTQRELIKSAYDEKDAIKSLVSDGYNKWLDALQKSIDLRKKELDSVSDLYSYQKNIAKLAKETANYEKQWLALQGDDSEENKATLQKVTVALQDSRDALQESEYEQWKTDQQKMLDDLEDNAQEWVNQRLDNIDGLISDVITATNTNSDSIKDTLENVTSDVGIKLSSEMYNIWNGAADGISSVVSEYGSKFDSNLTTVNSTLGEIKRYVEQISNIPMESENDIVEVTGGSNSNDSFDMNKILKNIQATTFIDANKQEATREKDYYAPLNQYIYDRTGGYVLSKKNEARLAKLLNVKITTDLRGNEGRKEIEKILAALKLTGFSEGGTIGKVIKRSGEDGFILARTGEEVLSLEKIDRLKETLKLVNPTPNIKPFEPFNVPVRTQNIGNNIDKVQMEINLPNVTNYEEFKSNLIKDRQFEKVIQTMTLGNALGGNTLNKYRIR